MSLQEELEIECPYCGERITLLVDSSAGSQEYIEDCQVCCKPINVYVTVNEEGLPRVAVRREDE
jgi:Cysteine-rich CPXCG